MLSTSSCILDRVGAGEGASSILMLSTLFFDSNRLKSAVAVGIDVPPRIVSRAT
jgi:hypothetical protein